jgi:hypothetical protein
LNARQRVLNAAKTIITTERNNAYGPPEQDFTRTASILNAMGYRGPDGRTITGVDVARIMICLKLSRSVWSPTKEDTWVDIAGYAACAMECAEAETPLEVKTEEEWR